MVKDKRPNILMIMADQFRLNTLEGMGDEIPTPNIRRIMDKGMVFTQASCTCPLCTPSRASLATGRYPSRCGVTVHDAVLPVKQATYYQAMRKAGYRVAIAGKSDLHKADKYCGTEGDLPSLYQYGFTDPFETEGKMNCAWISYNEDGSKRMQGPYQKYLEERGLLERLNADYKSYMREKPRYYAAPSVLPSEDFQDEFIGRAANKWLLEVEDDVPWHYFVSFVGPHNPWDPPAEDYNTFAQANFPPAIEDDFEKKPQWVKRRAGNQTGGMTQDQLQNVKRCYAASVQVIDRWVGQLLDTLEERSLAQNTVVIFCADHGELLGDHGLLEKKAMYETSVRIPLVVHTPWMEQRQDSTVLAQLMDLAPTCLDFANISWDEKEMDAKSLLPFLQPDPSSKSHHPVQISELLNCQMVYDGRYKWIRNWNDIDELYDLEQDPHELHNIIEQHPEIITRLQAYTFRQ
ncbi:MAG: sulfatase [Oscillospiraceae bacterium]